MITVKLYAEGDFRQRVIECESVTVLRPANCAIELTLHGMRVEGEISDRRFDLIGHPSALTPDNDAIPWERAIIENANGKTSEIIFANGHPSALVR